MFPIRTIFLIIFSFFSSCMVNQPDPHYYPGMRKISSGNNSFYMGSTSQYAASTEKPQHKVGFAYDYWIDTSEVTVEAYAATTGVLPKKYTDTTGLSKTPVCFITWYDAMLYCNMRSQAEGLDTVYRYSNAEFDAEGRAYRLDGLKADLQKTGYRMPTEAEWEYTAYGGYSAAFPWGDEPDVAAAEAVAWFGSNSQETVKTVCRLLPNIYGVYDMFGNVAEWVNDYMGSYTSDTIINYTGISYNTKDERPVKGGCFLSTIDKLRASSRTDVYTVYSSTSTAYIGFRCCVGAIPQQQGTTHTSLPTAVDPVTISVSDITQILPGRNAKLVFVNCTNGQNYLCYTDFNEYNKRVYCYTDFSPVYAPVISPDGRWVAFSTRDEGSLDASEIYLRKLDATGSKMTRLEDVPAFLPRWWVDTLTGETYIVYTNSGADNVTASWRTSTTKMQKVVNGQAVGKPLILNDDGSYHGGLSVGRKYLATGYSRLYMKDLVTATCRMLFTGPQNGKAAGDTSQVCNVSISPDRVDGGRVLFLDFGSGKTASTITGTTYFTHEIIFMSDFDGNILSWYRCPETAVEWNYPEWSFHPGYAVATAKPKSSPQVNKEIYLINLATKAYTKLAEGAELLHPYLWFSTEDINNHSLNTDSLGYYNDPPSSSVQYQFALKMPGFWEQCDSIDILCLGSSRMQNGVIPSVLEPYHTYHLSYSNGDLYGVKNILNNYVFAHCSRLKAVIISIDVCYFNKKESELYWNDITRSKGYQYDLLNDFWKSGLPEGFLSLMKLAENPYEENVVKNNGWVSCETAGWGPRPATYIKGWDWQVNDVCNQTMTMFEAIVDDLQKRNIILVGIVFPMSPAFKETPVFGTYGPGQQAARQLLTRIAAIDSQYAMFHFYDVHNFGDHSYTDDDAANESHLSETGARKLSLWLKGELATILPVNQ